MILGVKFECMNNIITRYLIIFKNKKKFTITIRLLKLDIKKIRLL